MAQAKKKLLKATPGKNKRVVYNVVMFFLALGLFVGLELMLRVFNYGNDLSLFNKSVNYPGCYEINSKLTLRYFTKVGNTSPTSDIFLINKPDTCYRIFVFGGSTTRGYPYQEGTSFPRILYYRLQDAYPNKRIEVVNLSASAINSYSYVDMMDEVLEHSPDAILIYGGHNEYYGALGVASVENGGNVKWLKKLNLWLGRLRSYQLVQRLISSIAKHTHKQEDNVTLMERIVRNKEIEYNSPMFKMGINQFQTNLNEIVEKAQKHNVKLVLSELVSNVSDQPPFKSTIDATLENAIDLYNLAKYSKDNLSNDEQKTMLFKAKDKDVIRFRAPEEFNDIIHKIGEINSIPVVPMKKCFEQNSPNSLIGNNLMLDHLHPNIDGYFLMADAFFTTIVEKGIIEPCNSNLNYKQSGYYRANWGFTALDSIIGDLNIKYLKSGWPFQEQNKGEKFLQSYKAKNRVDSMAFAYLTSQNRHIENEHIKLAKFYASKLQYNKAFSEYYSLIKMHPYIADLYYDASKYLITQEKFEQAFHLLSSAPFLPKNYFYHYSIGTLCFELKNYKQAILHLELAMDKIPEKTSAENVLLALCKAYEINGNHSKMQKTLERIKVFNSSFALRQSPSKKTEQAALTYEENLVKAENAMKRNEFEKARAYLDASSNTSNTFKGNYLYSLLYLMQKKHRQAFEFSVKAYEIDPFHYENLNNLYVLVLMTKNLDYALQLLEELRQINPDYDKMKRLETMYVKRKKELNTNIG